MGPIRCTSPAYSIRGRRPSPAPCIGGENSPAEAPPPSHYAACESELVAERCPNDPRPKNGLRDDELVGVGEHAGVRIAQVLHVHMGVPGILRHTERRIIGGVR